MFERFTDNARHVVVQAQSEARQFGHGFIGCEHLLLALVTLDEPAAAVLREHGLTPERTRAELIRLTKVPACRPVDLLNVLDREALAAIGIDLDVVRSRIEATFGPDALARAVPGRRSRPARGWLPRPARSARRLPVMARNGATLDGPPRSAVISRSRPAPRRPCSSRCVRRSAKGTTTSGCSTSRSPCSARPTGPWRPSCRRSACRATPCAVRSSTATAKPADRPPGRVS